MTDNNNEAAEIEATLKLVAEGGSDLSQPMMIDFQIVVPDEETGKNIVEAAAAEGFDGAVFFDDEIEEWTCECSQEMIAGVDTILAAERNLAAIAGKFGGEMDGWGTFGNNEDDEDDDDQYQA